MKKLTHLFVVAICLTTHVALAQNISTLYKEVNQSVVTILTETKVLKEGHQVSTDEGIGSGVLISEEGEILTAAHVVNNAEKITVKFLNGEEILAKVIRSAPVADIALIKLSWMPKEFKVAEVGDSDEVSVGQQIIVVGAPYGLEHSLSVGYISGRKEQKGRTSGFTINEFFQTDASINQGNSGGPMFNLNGEVIGISSYIITESGGFQGLGFAATSNLAKKLVIDGNRRWTGINGYFLSKGMAWILNVPFNGGLLVESVVRFSPADFAGLRGGITKANIEGNDVILGGDIILSVNDIPLTQETAERLNGASDQDNEWFNQKTYKLKVLRGGNVEEITLEFKD